MSRTLDQYTQDLSGVQSRLQSELRKLVTWGALKAEREAKLGQRRAGIKTRSGAMIQKTSGVGQLTPGGAEIVLRVDVPYGNVHEYGATIRARGKWLTIPLPAAKTAAGVTRASARSIPGLFFLKSKKGNALLVRRVGDRIEPMFILKREVTVPARSFARPAIEIVRRELPDRLGVALRTAIGSRA